MREAAISSAEIARFNVLAADWWDPSGPMRPLHQMNPARIAWIDRQISKVFPNRSGLRLLDVGCGAGLAAEALARRGYDVLGIDAAPATIEAARAHAEKVHAAQGGARIAYRLGVLDDVITEGLRFPVVTALEVIEHVPDQQEFVTNLSRVTEPGGVAVISTLNRTARSWLAAKLGAEYLLRWLPVGTHDWRRFVTPSELSAYARRAGFSVTASAGLSLDPLRGEWRASKDLNVNYIMAFRNAFRS